MRKQNENRNPSDKTLKTPVEFQRKENNLAG